MPPGMTSDIDQDEASGEAKMRNGASQTAWSNTSKCGWYGGGDWK